MSTPSQAADALSQLVDRLDEKSIKKAMRSAMGAEARKLRKVAVSDLESTGIENAGAIGKTIRARATKKLDGYYVRANNRGRKNMHRTTAGKDLPIAYWWERGAKDRNTKSGKRKAHRTGDMGGTSDTDFLKGARAQIPAGTERLGAQFEKSVKRIASKTFKN